MAGLKVYSICLLNSSMLFQPFVLIQYKVHNAGVDDLAQYLKVQLLCLIVFFEMA
jgi:hypothetical protein